MKRNGNLRKRSIRQGIFRNDLWGNENLITMPKPAVVQVYFPARKMTLAYFNEIFHLKVGDIVFVAGKMSGIPGRVIEINHNFKIKRSEYQHIAAVGKTDIKGQFHLGDSHFITFGELVLPIEKIKSWYFAQDTEDYVINHDDESFPLEKLSEMKISADTASRGKNYFMDDRVIYLCLDDIYGYALVEGSGKYYNVEFHLQDGQISKLTCDCFCSEHCKHEFAVMLQLREILDTIEKDYAEIYQQSRYFAAVSKTAFLANVMHSKKRGAFLLK